MPKPDNPQSSPRPESVRDLAAAQAALAQRLDALKREIRRLTADDDEAGAARLAKLQEAVADLAAAHHEVHRQLDALTGAVEQMADDRSGDGEDSAADIDQPLPAAFVPPVAQRGWRPRLKGWAKVVLRSTLGKLRHVWDSAHPRPPWGDDVRFLLEDAPAKLPSLTVVIPAGAEAGGIEARLERQTDGDVVQRIHDPNAVPAIDTDYVWDVRPGDVGSTLVETARLLLATEELGFACFQTPGTADQWIVARELRHPDGGLDAEALCRRAKRRPGRVLGKIAGGDDELLPRALCRPQIRRRVRRSGRYVLAVATRPRTVEHRLAPPRVETRSAPEDTSGDDRPSALLLLTADLAGGLERVVAAMLEDMVKDVRPVLATTVQLTRLSAPRWRALERFTPHLYALGDIFAEQLHAGLIQELLARHGAGSLLHAGGGKAWPALAADLRQRLPGLHVTEPALRLVVNPATELEPDAGSGVRRELGWPEDAVVVAMCADLIAGQRPEDFVALAHRLRDDDRFRFLLAGDGPLAGSVRDLARLFGLRNLRTEPAQRELGEILAAADIVCTTAEHDPYPHATIAALQRRRPVVAAAVGDLPRLLEAGPCGIVVPHPGDLDGFEAALRSLAEDQARQELGDRGPQAVRDVWSPLPLGERPG